jgi:hypothetical protein
MGYHETVCKSDLSEDPKAFESRERAAMENHEIEELFIALQLETEEKRTRMRFAPLVIEENSPVQVITTNSTSHHTTVLESHGVA